MQRIWIKPIMFDIKPGLPVILEGPLDAMTFLRLEWLWPITEEWKEAWESCDACLNRETDTAEPSYAPMMRALAKAGVALR